MRRNRHIEVEDADRLDHSDENITTVDITIVQQFAQHIERSGLDLGCVIAGSDEPSEGDRRLLQIAQSGSRPVPVLVLARQGSTRGAIDFMDAGAYDYVAKPGDPAELLAVVRAI